MARGNERLKVTSRTPASSCSEVPRQIVVPAATVTEENVADYEQYAFN